MYEKKNTSDVGISLKSHMYFYSFHPKQGDKVTIMQGVNECEGICEKEKQESQQ